MFAGQWATLAGLRALTSRYHSATAHAPPLPHPQLVLPSGLQQEENHAWAQSYRLLHGPCPEALRSGLRGLGTGTEQSPLLSPSSPPSGSLALTPPPNLKVKSPASLSLWEDLAGTSALSFRPGCDNARQVLLWTGRAKASVVNRAAPQQERSLPFFAPIGNPASLWACVSSSPGATKWHLGARAVVSGPPTP